MDVKLFYLVSHGFATEWLANYHEAVSNDHHFIDLKKAYFLYNFVIKKNTDTKKKTR